MFVNSVVPDYFSSSKSILRRYKYTIRLFHNWSVTPTIKRLLSISNEGSPMKTIVNLHLEFRHFPPTRRGFPLSLLQISSYGKCSGQLLSKDTRLRFDWQLSLSVWIFNYLDESICSIRLVFYSYLTVSWVPVIYNLRTLKFSGNHNLLWP